MFVSRGMDGAEFIRSWVLISENSKQGACKREKVGNHCLKIIAAQF